MSFDALKSAQIPDITEWMRSMYFDCPRKVYYTYIAGIEIKNRASKPLILGRTFHEGLWFKRAGEISTDAIHLAQKNLIDDMVKGEFDTDEIEKAKIELEAYLTLYFKTYPDKSIQFEPQMMFTKNGEKCKIEGLFFDGLNHHLVIDRTTSDLKDDMESFVKIDSRTLNPISMLRDNGYNIKSVYYREILKTKTRVKKTETTDEYRERLLDIYNESPSEYTRQIVFEVDQYALDSFTEEKKVVNEFLKNNLKNTAKCAWPKNTNSCIGVYGKCDNFDICTNGDKAAWLSSKYKPNYLERTLDDGNARKLLGLIAD